MARKYKKRYRRKGRWSANIKELAASDSLPVSTTSGNTIDLCKNPAQTDSTVSQQYTVKNIELSIFIETQESDYVGYIQGIQHYIMFVPQGMQLSTNYPNEHPEYIMAYRYQGNPIPSLLTTQGIIPNIKIKTRLARRLQTGDKIVYFYKAQNTHPTKTISYIISGLVRFWTKAN